MDSKEATKRTWMKIGFGILFVAACFIAMYILMEFHGNILMVGIAAVVLLISAFLFLNAVFSNKVKKTAGREKEQEDSDIAFSGSSTDGEFRLKISKHMKEMEGTQKELIDVLKNQNSLLQTQLESLENAIYMLSEKQMNQAKSIIKFNKENARQLAISERETLEYVMMELKKTIEEKAVQVVSEARFATAAPQEAAAPVVAVLEEISEAELFKVSDFAEDDAVIMPDLPQEELDALLEADIPDEEPVFVEEPIAIEEPVAIEEPIVIEEPVAIEEPIAIEEQFNIEEALTEEPAAEEMEIPDLPEDFDLSELFDIPELFDGSEETPVEELPLPEEVVPEETAPVAEEKTEEPAPAADPLAGLSGDPNAMMTPEDIAKLLAAMGQ